MATKGSVKNVFSTSTAITSFVGIVQAKRVRRMKWMIKCSGYLVTALLMKEEFMRYTAIANVRIQQTLFAPTAIIVRFFDLPIFEESQLIIVDVMLNHLFLAIFISSRIVNRRRSSAC